MAKIMFVLFTLILSGQSFSSVPPAKTEHETATNQLVTKPQLGAQQQQELLQNLRTELIKANEELSKYKQDQYQYELDYTKKYYAYLGQKADVNIEQFKWQRSASERLLWLVVVVVFSGVVFSGVQLWRAASIKHLSGESTVEIEASKIKITTSVVGVVVLAISIVFFYFFLIEVYRIKIVDMSPAEVKPTVSNSSQTK